MSHKDQFGCQLKLHWKRLSRNNASCLKCHKINPGAKLNASRSLKLVYEQIVKDYSSETDVRTSVQYSRCKIAEDCQFFFFFWLLALCSFKYLKFERERLQLKTTLIQHCFLVKKIKEVEYKILWISFAVVVIILFFTRKSREKRG